MSDCGSSRTTGSSKAIALIDDALVAVEVADLCEVSELLELHFGFYNSICI